MLLSSYLNLGILFLATANALVISDPHATEASRRHQQQQISTPALQKRSIGILPWKRQAPATEPEEGSEDLPADGDGSIPQGKSNSWLGDWWDNLKLNPFAKDGTEEEPEEGGGFFAGLFGSNGKEEKPPKEKEQKQPSKGIFGGLFGGADKSEQEPKSSSGSWFKNPFGGGSNPDPEPESSSGSWFKNPFGGGSNNNGASGEDNSRSTAVDPEQGPSRGFDESVGMNTQLNRPPMSSSLQPTSSGTDPALMQLNRASRRRLKKYDTKEQQRIDTLRLNRQPIPTDDPSLLVIANPVERLKAYDARRDRQRQDKMRSDQVIKNQKGSLSQDEQRLLNNYDQLERAQNPNSPILAIKDSRERLTKYKLRDKNKKPLTSQEQQRLDRFDAIEKQNPSSRILKTADPRNRLQRYEQREAQRQKNAAAKNKGQPASGQRNKAAANLPSEQQQSTANQKSKNQPVAGQTQATKQVANSADQAPKNQPVASQTQTSKQTANSANQTPNKQPVAGPTQATKQVANSADQKPKKQPAASQKQPTKQTANSAPKLPSKKQRKAERKAAANVAAFANLPGAW